MIVAETRPTHCKKSALQTIPKNRSAYYLNIILPSKTGKEKDKV